MDPVNVTVIHGTMSRPEANWFPWLATELGKVGVAVKIPKFPTPDGQSLSRWLDTFDHEVGPLNSNSILVGHSVGAAFSLRVIERLVKPIRATFLVSGFTRALCIPDFDPLIKTFIECPFDWNKVRGNSNIFKAYAGSNDPYVAMDLGLEMASNLGIKLTVVPLGGHLNAEAGYTSFDDLLRDVVEIVNTPSV